MFLTKRVKQVAVGLIAMIIAMSTFGLTLSTTTESYFGVVRGLQLMATVVLFYGAFKENTLHKDKFLLIWLAITALLFSGLCRECTEMLPRFIYYYPIYCLYVLQLVIITAILAFLMYFMYKNYVDLKQSKSETATESTQLLQEKAQSPTYMSTFHNLSVLIE